MRGVPRVWRITWLLILGNQALTVYYGTGDWVPRAMYWLCWAIGMWLMLTKEKEDA